MVSQNSAYFSALHVQIIQSLQFATVRIVLDKCYVVIINSTLSNNVFYHFNLGAQYASRATRSTFSTM